MRDLWHNRPRRGVTSVLTFLNNITMVIFPSGHFLFYHFPFLAAPLSFSWRIIVIIMKLSPFLKPLPAPSHSSFTFLFDFHAKKRRWQGKRTKKEIVLSSSSWLLQKIKKIILLLLVTARRRKSIAARARKRERAYFFHNFPF